MIIVGSSTFSRSRTSTDTSQGFPFDDAARCKFAAGGTVDVSVFAQIPVKLIGDRYLSYYALRLRRLVKYSDVLRRQFCSDPVPMYGDSTISHCDDLIRQLRIPFCYHNAHHPFGTPSDASAAYSCLALTSTLAITRLLQSRSK
jgi:hypothetical protein